MRDTINPGEEYANWKSPKSDTGDQKEVAAEKELNIEELDNLLKELYSENELVVHQTWHDSAEDIMNADFFSGGPGITGTALLSNPERIIDLLPELDKPSAERQKLTHKGADSMVIMTFSKKLLREKIAAGSMEKGVGLIDEVLWDKFGDKFEAGEIKNVGIPNSNVLGYYFDKKFRENPNYDPKF
jgi:hypothetical protein